MGLWGGNAALIWPTLPSKQCRHVVRSSNQVTVCPRGHFGPNRNMRVLMGISSQNTGYHKPSWHISHLAHPGTMSDDFVAFLVRMVDVSRQAVPVQDLSQARARASRAGWPSEQCPGRVRRLCILLGFPKPRVGNMWASSGNDICRRD